MVESGSGTLEYEGETRMLSAGDCVFLDCRRPYRHYTGDDLWQLRWAHFYGPNMAAIYKKYRERGGQPSFHPENTAPYTRRLEALYTLATSDNYVRDMQICEGLFALLTLLMQESWHPEIVRTAGTKRQNVQEIKDYLDLHFAEKITLDALAERFYINKFYLTRVFKEQFGLSVTSYLTQLRITQAKRLLRFTDKSVENVAQECGLNDANYFSRLFKKVEGTTPGEYRRSGEDNKKALPRGGRWTSAARPDEGKLPKLPGKRAAAALRLISASRTTFPRRGEAFFVFSSFPSTLVKPLQERMLHTLGLVAGHCVERYDVMLRKMLFSMFGLSRIRRRSRTLTSCRLEPPPPLSQIVQASVKRQAHWMNSSSL